METNKAKANIHMIMDFFPCDLSYSVLNINLIGIGIIIFFNASNDVANKPSAQHGVTNSNVIYKMFSQP